MNLLFVLSIFILGVWLIQGLDLVIGVLRMPDLILSSPTKTFGDDRKMPRVSVLFAARNEADALRPALQSLLAQTYPDYEVIVINDRSTDETPHLLSSFQNSKLKVIHIQTLPPGWLGKNHALYQGFREASGEFLIFTDADVIFHPGTLTAAVNRVQNESLDHLVLFPQIEAHGFWEKLFTTAFGIAFFRRFRPWAAKNPKSKAYAGVGAFNMVRRGAYETIGTHQKLAMHVLDDMILGRTIKQAGFRQAVMSGTKLLKVAWVRGFQGVLKAIEKNAFAGLEYKIPLVCAATVFSILFDVLPFVFLFSPLPEVRFLAGLTLLMIFAVYAVCRLKISGSLWMFVFHPFGSLTLLVLIWRSVILALKQGGIRWRETFYPLEDLRHWI